MNETVLNGELTLQVPDGFHTMTEKDMEGMRYAKGAPNWCVKDPERHIIISMSWKKSLLGAFLMKPKEVVRYLESAIRTQMLPFGYQNKGAVTEDVGGVEAQGFLYFYDAEGIEMAGVTLSLKRNKQFYYIYCYMRRELMDESLQLLRQIFTGARWK